MNKTIIIVLASIGAIFLLMVLSCAGLLWYGVHKAQHLVAQNMVIAVPPFEGKNMPPSVPDSIPSLIVRLASAQQKSTAGASQLNPGLTEEKVHALEEQYNLSLTPELRSLYENCDGGSGDRHYFTDNQIMMPLAVSLQQRQTFKEAATTESFLSALKSQAELLPLFMSASFSTSYYWDPRKAGSDGAFFSREAMTGVYRVYPSLNNMVAAMVECQETGVYAELSLKNPVLSPAAHDKEAKIHEKYGLKIQGKPLDLDP